MNKDELNLLLDKINNPVIGKALLTTFHKLNYEGYKKVLCSISGGADSDVILDLVTKCDNKKIVDYVFFDTGLEYQATKEHIKFLEEKYNIEIEIMRPKVPIPLSCKRYGQPFLSKRVSEMISRLQKHDFKWEDKPFEELVEEYPNCKSALMWWCNAYDDKSKFNIKYNKLLKEFLIANPPSFTISNKCCKYAKKDLAHDKIKQGYDLNITGVRKAEGGVRASAYKSCFDTTDKGYDNYRPIFWFKDSDKSEYNGLFNISNSRCYSEYGLKRTGCCGCPYGRDCNFELKVLEEYEPKLHKAVINVFKDAYEYTEKYYEFRNNFKEDK